MITINLALFILIPVLSIFILIFSIGITKKNRLIIFLLMAGILAIVAFYFNPRVEYDLYRHHKKMEIIRQYNFNEVKEFFVKNNEVEPLRILVMYLVSQATTNNNILQLIITFIGYSIIFYMINDYAKIKNIKNWIVLFTTIFIFFSLYYVDFISNLWNHLAIIIFSLGIYLEYIKKKNKKICYLLYIITPLLHISMIIPLVLKIVFSYIYKEKINKLNIIILFIILIVPFTLINILPNITDNYIILSIVKMYNNYFIEADKYETIYGGKNLILTISQLIIYAYILFKTKEREKINNIAILYLLSVILLVIDAQIFSRFVFLIQLISIPILDNYLNDLNNKNIINKLFIVLLVIFTITLGILRIRNFINLNLDFNNIFDKKITSNLFYIITDR